MRLPCTQAGSPRNYAHSQCVSCVFAETLHYSDGRGKPPPPCEIIDDEPEWELEKVLNHRLVKRGRKTKVEHLLSFVGYDPEHELWRDDVEIVSSL